MRVHVQCVTLSGQFAQKLLIFMEEIFDALHPLALWKFKRKLLVL